MRSILSFFLNALMKVYKTFRVLYLAFLIIIIILIVWGKQIWKDKATKREHQTQTHKISPPQREVTASINKEIEEKEEDEEENEEEDNSPEAKSSWTILQTALPAHYFEPSLNTQTPSVAIILTGLGLSKTLTEHVLMTVNKKITLAFSPYSQNINDQLQRATSLGFQTIIGLPMEPYAYPNPDPGPSTVLTGTNETENIRKTKVILDTIPKGTGVIGEFGSRFTSSQVDLEPVLKEIKDHGSIFIDPNTTLHSQVQKTCKAIDMPCLQVGLTLPISTNSIEENEFVKKIIQNAKENGIIIISVPAVPAFTDHLLEWIDTLEKNGINLVKIAGLKAPEPSLDASRIHQGTTDANKQDSHQPR